MRARKPNTLIAGLILILAVAFAAPSARADQWNESTRLTFSQPMEIPGHRILAADTYWFETMADLSVANDNVVQIFNADHTRIVATLPSVAIQRQTLTASTEVNFAKQGANEPNVLVSWFYPGSGTGHEFIYSRQEEKAVASEPALKVMAHPAKVARAYGD